MLHPEFCLSSSAIWSSAIFHSDNALFVFAERNVDDAVVFAHMAVDNGEIFLLDGTTFHNFSQLTRNGGILRHDHHTAGFAVKTIDQMRLIGC